MKIYIVGPVASGKSTLAKKISRIRGLEYTELDGLVHIKDQTKKKWGNIRRSDDAIQGLFLKVLENKDWLVEDAGRLIFNDAMIDADLIIHLDIKSYLRKIRIITRYIKQKMGLESCLYTPNIRMLKFLWSASKNYDLGRDDLKKRLKIHKDKLLVIRNKKDYDAYLNNLNEKYRKGGMK